MSFIQTIIKQNFGVKFDPKPVLSRFCEIHSYISLILSLEQQIPQEQKRRKKKKT